jgi:Niemann-Pick C1 protein
MGVKIDTASSVCLIIVVGLCVDYASHIAHSFSVAEGSTRQERTSATLVSIGPAILNGGTSTLLALVVLGFSTSHAFIVLFKARISIICQMRPTNLIDTFLCRYFHFQSPSVSSTV